jgi:nucleotidyltransferase substrate binding protein (TIGR01987 family)
VEKLNLQQIVLTKALKTLDESFLVLEKAKRLTDVEIILAAQDSIIQRFEYSYDGFWKFVKTFLETYYSMENIGGPRNIFRALIELKICSEAKGQILMNMIDDRNITSHKYDIDIAHTILPNVPAYHRIMHEILLLLIQK